jgi:hypothetical protein
MFIFLYIFIIIFIIIFIYISVHINASTAERIWDCATSLGKGPFTAPCTSHAQCSEDSREGVKKIPYSMLSASNQTHNSAFRVYNCTLRSP